MSLILVGQNELWESVSTFKPTSRFVSASTFSASSPTMTVRRLGSTFGAI